MKSVLKCSIIGTCCFLVYVATLDVSSAASAVKALTPSVVKDRPGINMTTKKGSFDFQNLLASRNPDPDAQELVRLMELLVIGKAPASVPIDDLVYRDSTTSQGPALCLLAARQLEPTARNSLLSKVQRSDGCYLYGERYSWIGRNKLEAEDTLNTFKQKYLPQIKQAATKVASYKGFQEIIWVGMLPVDPNSYYREKGGFSLCGATGPGADCRWSPRIDIPMLHLEAVKPVGVWKVTEARARQLMNGPLTTRQLLPLETIVEVGGVRKVNGRYMLTGHIKSIALYAKSDMALSSPLHRFAKEDFTDTASTAAREAQEREQARLASLERVELARSKYFLAAYAELSGKGLKLVDEIVEQKRYQGNPFDIKRQKDKDRAQMREILIQELARFDRNKPVWISGILTLGPYNIQQSYFPLGGRIPEIHVSDGKGDPYANLIRVQLLQSQIERLPVPPDIAERIYEKYGGRGAYFRALVKPVNTGPTGKARGAGRTLDLAVERLELLSTDQHVAVLDEKNVVWRFTPPTYETLQADAAQEQERIAQQKRTCAASKSRECYDDLCAKIKKTGDMKEIEWCVHEQSLAYKESRFAEHKTTEAKRQEEMEKQRQSMVVGRACQNRYTAYGVQPWMPVEGTPEFQNAMTACQKEPVRDVYGPDILGLRLGMPLNEANNFIRRQSVKQNTTLKDTRPFEKATLYWTDDGNHGIAVFSLVNGEYERVAAVSRRLYFGDKGPSRSEIIDGLRKKYGAELWSDSDRVKLWSMADGAQKPSGKMCSGLVNLIEPREGWSRAWGAGSSAAREDRRAARQADMSARMSAQQECVAKYGMPMGGQPGAVNMQMMQELQRCLQEKALGTQAAPAAPAGTSARLPMTVKASGSPKLYEGYQACGPVIVAYLNSDTGGALKDLSLVLFDPGWIARQPAFAFASDAGKTHVKF